MSDIVSMIWCNVFVPRTFDVGTLSLWLSMRYGVIWELVQLASVIDDRLEYKRVTFTPFKFTTQGIQDISIFMKHVFIY